MIVAGKGESSRLVFLLITCCVLVTWRSYGQPGALDLTFSTNASASSTVSGDSSVSELALASDGKIVLGGSFNLLNGELRPSLGRLLGSGALDTNFTSSATGVVYAVAIDASDGVVFGGFFSRVNGQPHTNLARFNADGTLDASFQTHCPVQVQAIGVQPGGKVIVGGIFTNVISGGVSGHRFAITRLNPDGSDDGTFAGRGIRRATGNASCSGIKIQPDGKILVVGGFETFDGMSVSNLIRLNEDTTLDTTFRADFAGGLIAIGLQPNGKVLISGSFQHADGIWRNMARLNSDGSLDESFQTEARNILTIDVDLGGRIYVGGDFVSSGFPMIDGFRRGNIARLFPNGAIDATFDPGTGANDSVRALVLQPDGNLVIAGRFSSYNGQVRRRIARVLGGSVPPAGPTILIQPTNQIAKAGAWVDLLVGAAGNPQPYYQWQKNGTNIPGATRSRYSIPIATPEHSGTYTVIVSNELDVALSDGAVLTVNNYPPGFTRYPTSQLLIEGQNLRMFCIVTGAPFPSVRWQLNGVDIPTNVFPFADVSNFAVTNVSLAHAGEYRVIASNTVGVATSDVAQVTIIPAATNAGAVDISFIPQSSPWGPLTQYPPRAAVMQPDGKILVGADLGRLWRWLPDGRLDSSFTNIGAANVEAFALQTDGKIIVGGGVVSPVIARLNANGSGDTNFVTFAGGLFRVRALAVQPDGKIIYASDSPSSGNYPIFGRILSNGAPDVNFRTLISPLPPGGSQGAPVTAYALLLQPDGKIIFASSSGGIVRYLPNGTRDWAFSPFNPGVPVGSLSMALQNDGKLVVGWHGNNDIVNFVRLHTDGSRDLGFAPSLGGLPGGMGGPINDLLLQPDGKVVAVGVLTNRTRLMRFHPNGALDTDFAVGDILPAASPGAGSSFVRVFLAPDCKPVVVGNFARFSNYERDGAFRVLTDPPLPPAVTRQPASLTVHRGQIARFSADVTCPPAPSYQWFFNDAPIGGSNRPWLTITNAETTDAGNYALGVTNPLGSNQSAVVSLTVNPAPTNNGAVDVDFMAALPNDTVLAAVRQPDGRLLVAGNFTKVGTSDRAYIARLNADGSVDETFDGSVITNTTSAGPAVISALALQNDGRILIGGTFDRVAGTLKRNLARLHPDGALDASFINGSISSSVLAIAVQSDRKILVSQAYYSPSLQRLTTNGANDTTFQYPVSLLPNRTIKSIALQPDGKILIAGDFTSVNGSQRTGLARLLTNGVVDQTLSDILAPVDTMALLPDAIVIGGAFNTVHGFPQRYLAAVNYSGIVLSNVWRPTVNQPVRLLVKDSCDRILAAGAFTNAGSTTVRGLLRFLHEGQADPTFAPPVFNSAVRAIAPASDDRLFAAGDFTEVNGCYRPIITALFEGHLTVPVFAYQPTNIATVTGRDFPVSATVICPPGTTYRWQLNGIDLIGETNTTVMVRNARSPQAGGYQLIASNQFGMSTSAVAMVTLSPAPRQPGDNDIDFYPDITNAQRVTAMALQPDGKLLAAHAPSTGARLQRYHPDGTRDLSFNSSISEPRGLAVAANGDILVTVSSALRSLSADGATTNFTVSYPGGFFYDLALQPDGKIILLGRFASLPTPHYARRFNTDGSVDATFNGPAFDHQVSCVVLQPDGKVLIGGGFTNVGAARSPFVARLNPNGTRDTNFVSGFTSNAWVYALGVLNDGRIVAAGSFTNYAGQTRRNIVRLHANGGLDTTFTGDLSGPAYHLAIQRDRKVLAAGSLTMQAGNQVGIVRLLATGAPDATFESGPIVWNAGLIGELVLAPDGDIYIGHGFMSYDGFTRFGLARLHGNPVILGPTYSSSSFSTSMFTDSGRTYRLESTASLANTNWTVVQTVIGNGAVQTFGHSPAGSASYYRIRAD